MNIRISNRDDLNLIIDFQLKMAIESEGLILDRDRLSKGVAAVYDNPEKGIYYVAEENGQLIASLLTTYEWSDWRNGTVLWIQSVYVIPEYRGKGVYRQMYEYLKEKVNSDPGLLGLRLYVEKDNISAQKVYERTGMDGEHYRMFEWFA